MLRPPPLAGTRAFSLIGGTLAAGASCKATLTVTPTAASSYNYTTGAVSATGATGGTATTNTLVVNVVPTVKSISPTTGPIGGNTPVTLTGTNFTGVSGAGGVKFGATNAMGCTAVNDTTITATAPAGSAGTVDITVTNSGTTSATSMADQYTYVAPPTVTALWPTVGLTSGGTSVVITGTGFSAAAGADAVKFGAKNASSYTINSNTQITATAPANSAGIYDITVTTPSGTSATSASGQFTYDTPPVSSSQTYGSIISYNEGSNQTTNIDLSLYLTGGGAPTSFAVGSATTAQGGTVSVNSSGMATYTPPVGYRNANDSFTYTATGPGGVSTPAMVSLTVATPVAPVVTPPIGPVVVPPSQGGSIAIDLGTVSQGVIDGFRITVTSAYGTTELIESGQAAPASLKRSATPSAAGGVQLIYTPVANFMGTDTVTVVAYGPGGDSAPATFIFQVTGKAPDMTGVIALDAVVRLSPTGGLVGGPFNAVRITRAPAFGTATVDGLDIVFTPGATTGGATSLDYVVDLPLGSSAAGRIDLNSNLVPGAQVLTAETLQGVPVTVRISNTAGVPFTGADVASINSANAGAAVVTGGRSRMESDLHAG